VIADPELRLGARSAADVRVRGRDAVQADHARRRGVRDREGLLPGLPARQGGGRGHRLAGGARVKLVTFDDGKVGRLEGDVVSELDVRSTREYFERAKSRATTGDEHLLADVTLRAPIVPKKFFHTAGNFREHEEDSKRVGWSHEIAPWIVFFQNVDAIIGPDEPIVYPEHLTQELDYELELAVVIKKAGKVVLAGGGGGLHRRLRDLQRHHGARHPAARDAVGRVLVLQGDRPRSARWGRGS
jgi:hypothetical protein